MPLPAMYGETAAACCISPSISVSFLLRLRYRHGIRFLYSSRMVLLATSPSSVLALVKTGGTIPFFSSFSVVLMMTRLTSVMSKTEEVGAIRCGSPSRDTDASPNAPPLSRT